MTAAPDSPASPQQAAVDAALLVLKSMGLSPEDLTAGALASRRPAPTFAEYVPVVSGTVIRISPSLSSPASRNGSPQSTGCRTARLTRCSTPPSATRSAAADM